MTTFATGEKLLSGRYESLDYECDESEISHMEEKRLGYQHARRLMVLKWVIMLLIGICTGLVAVFVDFCVKKLTKFKFSYVQNKLDSCLAEHCLYQPYLVWIAINVAMVLVASLLILWEVNIYFEDMKKRLNFILIISPSHVVPVFHKLNVILMVLLYHMCFV